MQATLRRGRVGTLAVALAVGSILISGSASVSALAVGPRSVPVRGCLVITAAQATVLLGKPAVKIHETTTATPGKVIVLNRGCTYKSAAGSFGYNVQTFRSLAYAKLFYSTAAAATAKAPTLVVKKNVLLGSGAFVRVYRVTGLRPFMDQIEMRKGSILFVTNILVAKNDGGAKAIAAAKYALPRM